MNVPAARHLVDAVFVSERLIVELDGWDFHNGRLAFERDRERDADTLAAGLATLRITWERLVGAPEAEAHRLRAILRARSPAAPVTETAQRPPAVSGAPPS